MDKNITILELYPTACNNMANNSQIVKNPKGKEVIRYNAFHKLMLSTLNYYNMNCYTKDLEELKYILKNKDSDIFWKNLFIFRDNIDDVNEHIILVDFFISSETELATFEKYNTYTDKNKISINNLKDWAINNNLNLMIRGLSY